jgi:hypothetical protein
MAMLDPSEHRDAARSFFAYFSLTPGGSVGVFLERLMEQFTTIPYENLSKIIKRRSASTGSEQLRLPEEVFVDHLGKGLGGTCFSLSFFLSSILHAGGLDSYICMAHMGNRMNVHCVTIADTRDGKFLLDPGYVITRPLRIDRTEPVTVKTPHAYVRLVFDSARDTFDLFAGGREGLKRRYSFRDDPVDQTRFLEYWQRSFAFDGMNDICLSVRRGDGLFYMHGDYLRETHIDGFTKRRVKGNVLETIRDILSVDPGTIEDALRALKEHRQLEAHR